MSTTLALTGKIVKKIQHNIYIKNLQYNIKKGLRFYYRYW